MWRSVVMRYKFRVYVAGQSERSEAAVANLTAVCEAYVPGRYEIEVVDVVERHDLAEIESIVATPTVVRHGVIPQRRVIGDLSDSARTAAALGLPAVGEPYGELWWT
jgi:circadian clock protein KaiB